MVKTKQGNSSEVTALRHRFSAMSDLVNYREWMQKNGSVANPTDSAGNSCTMRDTRPGANGGDLDAQLESAAGAMGTASLSTRARQLYADQLQTIKTMRAGIAKACFALLQCLVLCVCSSIFI